MAALGFPTVEIREGMLRLLVPPGFAPRGPGRRGPLPFFNPSMVVARDLAVLVQAQAGPLGKFADILAATGALGLRVAREAGPREVVLVDRDPRAVALMRENAARNGLEGVRIVHDDARALLARETFDAIEVDPYGSPVPFVDAALQALRSPGLFGCTATDTALLRGARPQACRRRYGAQPLRCPFGAEVALRLLLGSLVRAAAKFDLGAEPILAFAAEHFVRAYVRVRRGAARADASLEGLAYVAWDPQSGQRSLVPEPPRGLPWAGPLWAGPLGDAPLIAALAPREYMDPRTARLVGVLQGEVGLPALFYTTDELAKHLRTSPPPLQALIAELEARGLRAARTHLHPRGLRVAGPFEELLAAFRALAPSGDAEGHGDLRPGKAPGHLPRRREAVEGGEEGGLRGGGDDGEG